MRRSETIHNTAQSSSVYTFLSYIIIIVYYAKWQHRQKYNYIHKIQNEAIIGPNTNIIVEMPSNCMKGAMVYTLYVYKR